MSLLSRMKAAPSFSILDFSNWIVASSGSLTPTFGDFAMAGVLSHDLQTVVHS